MGQKWKMQEWKQPAGMSGEGNGFKVSFPKLKFINEMHQCISFQM